MKKRVQGLQIDTDKLILVKDNGIKVYRTSKCYYLMLCGDKYTLLKGQNLIDLSKSMGFEIEKFEKNSFFVHAGLTSSEFEKFEKFKKDYGLNTNQAIKKLIENI